MWAVQDGGPPDLSTISLGTARQGSREQSHSPLLHVRALMTACRAHNHYADLA